MQQSCYSECACSCNKVCLESCEGLEENAFCKVGCGCALSSTSRKTNQEAEPLAAEPVPQSETLTTCSEECTQSCVTAAKTKSETVQCFVDCECFTTPKSPNVAVIPDIVPTRPKSFNFIGYFILTLFISMIICFTGYMVIEREKKVLKNVDPEVNENMLYKRID